MTAPKRRSFVKTLTRALVLVLTGTCIFTTAGLAMVIPKSVSTIEEGAFRGNSTLVNVELPSSVTAVGKEAFADCVNLKTIRVYNKETVFDSCALGRVGDDRTIIGFTGSTAQAYATQYGFVFQPIITKAAELLNYADTFIGQEYVQGKLDCVLLVYKCYKNVLGITLPATCEGMRYNIKGVKIEKIAELQPGDIICWMDDPDIDKGEPVICKHVGMYVGAGVVNGRHYSSGVYIEASSGAGKVRYNLIPATGTGYYTRNFLHAWRVLDE